jgi:hypothetical protein
VFDDLKVVVDARCRAWNKLVADTARLVSLTASARAQLSPETP